VKPLIEPSSRGLGSIATSRPFALVGRKHPALHRKADWIGKPQPEHQILAARMAATLSRQRGMALAAPQVGHSLRLVVWDTKALCDPIVHVSGPLEHALEGCLSLPGRWYAVPRHTKAHVVGLSLQGERVEFDIEGVEARMWQHEHDHLEGLLIAGRCEEVRHPERWSA
jgi:peptide deformylase